MRGWPRRWAVKCAALAALMAGVSAVSGAFAASAQAQIVSEDSAVGDVITVSQRPIGFVFDAHSGPSGENPSGSATWVDRADIFGGPVTCLTVTGNRATIGFENQQSFLDFKGGFLFVEDNGVPGAGQDNIRGQLILDAAPTVCPPNTVVYRPGEFGDTVTSGELTVHDAQALPTSKDECKNGGYRQFGFKNPGQCVAFVERGPRH